MSVTVMESSSVPVDLPAKYQKLASEYAKIRAQYSVLKKAVVDEQNLSAELKEILRTKDQNLRKAEQELDSLNFRNQQLTKRVTILQDELEISQNTPKHKTKGNSKDLKNSVIIEELEKKITENANLITTLQEQTEKYESEKFRLNQRIELFERKIKEYETSHSLNEGNKASNHENEKKFLLSKIETKDFEIQKLTKEIKQLKNDIFGRQAILDTVGLKEKFFKLVQDLLLQDLLISLSNFFQQMEFWCNKVLDEKNFQKLIEVNKKNRLILQDFIDKYLLYCNMKTENEHLLCSETCLENVEQYAPILEELSECLCNSKNQEVVSVFKQITENIQKHFLEFSSTLRRLSSLSVQSSNQEEVISNFPEIFRSFRSTCDYILSTLNEKFKLVQCDSESEKEILSSLSKMSLQSGAIYRKLTENVPILLQVVKSQNYKMQQYAADAELKCDECCKNWKQEVEQLKISHSKKIKDLEEQILCLSGATTPCSTNSGNFVHSPVDDNNLDSATDSSANKEDAEYLKYFNARANKLVADRQYAESKVTILKDECDALKRRLEHSLESRLALEDSLKQSQATIAKLQEELQTTRINYEAQLQSMSEHMANMNERLETQQGEIDILKHELNEKGSKRGR